MSEQAPIQIYERDRELFDRLNQLPIDERIATSVEAIPLAARAVSYCQKNGISTIAQLAACKRRDLLKSRNLGRKTVAHISAYLNELGLGLDARFSATGHPVPIPPYEQGAEMMRSKILSRLRGARVRQSVMDDIASLPLP